MCSSDLFSQEEIVAAIDAVFPLDAVERTSAPATRFRYSDGGGEIGVVASVFSLLGSFLSSRTVFSLVVSHSDSRFA